MQQLSQILSVIKMAGCVECWVQCEPPSRSKHTHSPHKDLDDHLDYLRQAHFKDNLRFPFCYVCWIPFGSPFYHPRVSDSPCLNHEYAVQKLVLLIFYHCRAHPEIAEGVAALLVMDVSVLTLWINFAYWATGDTAKLPNHIRLITMYYQYRRTSLRCD